jgi:WD40 repeat protein
MRQHAIRLELGRRLPAPLCRLVAEYCHELEGRCTAAYAAHAGAVTALAALPDGEVAAGSAAGWVHIWSAAGGGRRVLASPGYCIRALADVSGLLAAGSEGRSVCAWRRAGAPGLAMTGHTGPVCALAALAGGGLASGAEDDPTVLVWDAATGVRLGALPGHVGGVQALAAYPGGVAAGAHGGGVWLWRDGCCVAILSTLGVSVRALAALPCGGFAAGLAGGQVLALAPGRDATVRAFAHSAGPVVALAALPDGSLVVGWGGGPPTAVERDGAQRALGGRCARSLAVLAGGRLATGHMDGTVRIWV